jgi:hypothetical protein
MLLLAKLVSHKILNNLINKTKFWEDKGQLKLQDFISRRKFNYNWDKLIPSILAVDSSKWNSKMN